MGTPEFAVASLESLLHAGCNIVGVITAPDKLAGRGMNLQQSAVKKFAESYNLKILQPEKLRNEQFLNDLEALNADLQICVAFRMLPEIVWDSPPMGTINLHGSLLPDYRGAAPINWAIINGEKKTGVTTFKLKHEIDAGDILLQEKIPISDEETAGGVHDRMKVIGANLLVKTVKALATSEIVPTPQKFDGTEKMAPKIFTEDCLIDFTQSVYEVSNRIRGLSPYPAAFCYIDNKKLKIYMATPKTSSTSFKAGEYETDGKTFLRFHCSDGYIDVTDLQLEGKKRMNVTDFLRGYRFNK